MRAGSRVCGDPVAPIDPALINGKTDKDAKPWRPGLNRAPMAGSAIALLDRRA